jgi:hypothetical protein
MSKANSLAIPTGFNPGDAVDVAEVLALLSDDGTDDFSATQSGAQVVSPVVVIERSFAGAGGFAESVEYPYAVLLPNEEFTLGTGPSVREVAVVDAPAAVVTVAGLAPEVVTDEIQALVPAAVVTVTAYAPEVSGGVAEGAVVDVPAAVVTVTAAAPEVLTDVVVVVPAAVITVAALVPEVSGGSLWTPADITTALWLDADDAGTITQSGGFVTEWRDKSGNSRHATDPGSGLRPAYQATEFNSKPTLDFDGSDDRLGLSTAIALASTNSFDIFIAMAPNTTGRSSAFGAGTVVRMPGSEAAGSFFVGYSSDGRFVCHHHLSGGLDVNGSIKSPASTFSSTSRLIAHYRYDSAGGAAAVDRWNMRLNGGSQLTKSTSSTSSGWGAHNTIGRLFGALYSHRGLISEIIITPSTISDADRERVEGYLAHKWGLTADLPTGHPYKTSPP